ncbi:type II toxin-antitoxin system PemK/MazF family toxin [Mycoplasmatota bacterium]|nr:type II toxin-antitoxin system PemK/MazF family toxin [Mycoplasmatota bacterium]
MRPCVIVQSDSYNIKSPVTVVAIISNSNLTIPDIQVPISGTYYYTENSIHKQLTGTVDLGQIKTVGKERLVSKNIATLTSEIDEINKKLLNAVGLTSIIIAYENRIKSLEGKVQYLQKKE